MAQITATNQTRVARDGILQWTASFTQAAVAAVDTRKEVAELTATIPKTTNPAVVQTMANARDAILDDVNKAEAAAQADYAAALDGMLNLAIAHVPYLNGAKDCSGKITELATMIGIKTTADDSDDSDVDDSDDEDSDNKSADDNVCPRCGCVHTW